MRVTVLVLMTLIGATNLVGIAQADQSTFALAGCCKERESSTDPWDLTARSFGDCQRENEERDVPPDNIFEQSGSVWWDITC